MNGKRAHKTQTTGPGPLAMLLPAREAMELWGFSLEASEAILNVLKD